MHVDELVQSEQLRAHSSMSAFKEFAKSVHLRVSYVHFYILAFGPVNYEYIAQTFGTEYFRERRMYLTQKWPKLMRN